MRKKVRFTVFLVGLLFGEISMIANEGALASPPRQVHALPAERGAEVVALVVRNEVSPGRFVERRMSVRADGRVTFVSPYGPPKQFETKIDRVALQDLLQFAIDGNQFFAIDGPALAKTVGQVTDDAATTTIRIRADGRDHEVGLVALGDAASMRPEIKALQQLHAIYLRLLRLMNMTIIGGESKLARTLQTVNAHLAREWPVVSPLAPDDLELAHPLPNDAIRLRFVRNRGVKDGDMPSTLVAEVDLPPEGAPMVRIRQTAN